MAWLSAISTVLSVIAYPVTYLLYFGYGVLQLLVKLLMGLARYPLRLALLPFRVLAHFEAILIFITAAAFIGLFLGMILHVTTHHTVELFNRWVGIFVTQSPLRLDSWRLELGDRRPQSGTVAKRSDTSDLASGGRLTSGGKKYPESWGASGPSASTILEEDDESSSAYYED